MKRRTAHAEKANRYTFNLLERLILCTCVWRSIRKKICSENYNDSWTIRHSNAKCFKFKWNIYRKGKDRKTLSNSGDWRIALIICRVYLHRPIVQYRYPLGLKLEKCVHKGIKLDTFKYAPLHPIKSIILIQSSGVLRKPSFYHHICTWTWFNRKCLGKGLVFLHFTNYFCLGGSKWAKAIE